MSRPLSSPPGPSRPVTADALAGLPRRLASGAASGAVESGSHKVHQDPTRATDKQSPQSTPLLPVRPHARGESGAPRASLTIMTGSDAGRMILLEEGATVLGRGPGVGSSIDDPGVSRDHSRISRGPDGGFMIEDLGSTNGTLVQGRRIAVAPLEPGSYVQLGANTLLRFAMVDDTDEQMHRRLYESSIHDPLTRVYNRRYLSGRLDAEVLSAQSTGASLALLMVDIDEFKQFNDRFGHMPGDRALCFIAAQIARLIGASNMLARYGGEEFVVVLPGSTHRDAMRLAERIRRGIEGLHFSVAGNSVSLTVSIGVGSLSENAGLDDGQQGAALVNLADERLYAAKRAGRNVVFGG